jgi:hypothetical protein
LAFASFAGASPTDLDGLDLDALGRGGALLADAQDGRDRVERVLTGHQRLPKASVLVVQKSALPWQMKERWLPALSGSDEAGPWSRHARGVGAMR